jgi:hypothetical protein
MSKLQLTLTTSEYSALFDLAMDELRSLPDQARYLIREGLQNRGKLSLPEVETKPFPDITRTPPASMPTS